MCGFTMEVINKISTWNWSGVITSTTSLITVIIAYIALSSWKKQHKTEKYTLFLDELTDAIHEYLQLIQVPVQQLKFIKIAINCYQNTPRLNNSLSHPEAVLFITEKGTQEAKALRSSLSSCQNSFNKIKSLSVKGQILNIENYSSCFQSCEQLTWQHGRLEAFCTIIGNPHLNWENPTVNESLESVLAITSEEIQAILNKYHIEYLNFVKTTYSKLYQET